MSEKETIPERGWARFGAFLAQARRPLSAKDAAEAVGGLHHRTVQSYERGEIDYPRPPLKLLRYAERLAGWTEADVLAMFDGGVMAPVRPAVSTPLVPTPISEETQARALAAIYGATDLSPREKKTLAAVLESIPTHNDPPTPPADFGDDQQVHAG